ncbi:MAG: S26 family signal peptidase [Methylobacter sp.]|nr:S26 family signal peptidase [Methylobacter sp.]
MSALNDHQSLTFDLFIERSKSFSPILVKHLKSHAITWALLVSLYGVVHANYRLAINQTPSLPYTLFLICLNDTVETGGFIAFKWHNGDLYPDGYTFTKRLLAGPGDVVSKKGRDFAVGERTLEGKDIGLSLKKLFPNDELREGKNTLQLNKYFVAGDHEYSLDSRYNLLGLVDKKDVIGRAYPIF